MRCARKIAERSALLLERFIQFLEESFPSHSLYIDMSSDRSVAIEEKPSETEDKLFDIATCLLMPLVNDLKARESMLSRLPLLEPFHNHPEITADIVRKLL